MNMKERKERDRRKLHLIQNEVRKDRDHKKKKNRKMKRIVYLRGLKIMQGAEGEG